MKVLSLKTKKKKTQLRYLFDFNKRRSVQNKILKDLKLSCNITYHYKIGKRLPSTNGVCFFVFPV